jgi:hypothetical protein
MPVALAPGMGLNAYFAYQIVGFNGNGIISYNMALTAVFVEGFVFVFLSLIGMRQCELSLSATHDTYADHVLIPIGFVKIIPASLKVAAACGIGLFLALIGLSNTTGIGAVSGAHATALQVAGCPEEFLEDGMCVSHKMTSHTVSDDNPFDEAMFANPQKDVAGCYSWRHIHSISHGIQSQECYDYGHSSCLDHLMAVSQCVGFKTPVS